MLKRKQKIRVEAFVSRLTEAQLDLHAFRAALKAASRVPHSGTLAARTPDPERLFFAGHGRGKRLSRHSQLRDRLLDVLRKNQKYNQMVDMTAHRFFGLMSTMKQASGL